MYQKPNYINPFIFLSDVTVCKFIGITYDMHTYIYTYDMYTHIYIHMSVCVYIYHFPYATYNICIC